jgi:sugar phosphate permease
MDTPTEQNNKKIGITILVLTSLFMVLQFFLQGSIGIMSSQVKQDLNLDAAGISLISSAFFYSYVVMQIPAGLLLDRHGIKFLPWTILLLGISCIFLGRCHSLYSAVIMRVILGICASFGFISLLSCIKTYFSKHYFAFLVSLTETLSMLGIWVSNWSFSQGVMHLGWRTSMVICGIITLALAIITFIFFYKFKLQKTSPQKETKNTSEKLSLKKILFNKHIWLCGLFSGTLYCVVTVFISLWSIPYLGKKYNLNIVEATNLSSCVYLGIALASPIFGWLSQKIKIQKFLIPNAVICTILTTAIIYLPLPKENYFLHIVMLLIGATCSVYQLVFSIINQTTPAHYQGIANGMTNMICMSGAPLIQPLIGLILTLTQNGILDGYENYSVAEYQLALWLIPLTLFISVYLAKKTAQIPQSAN